MSFKLTNSKATAIRAFIVEWAKDKKLYCNYCGMDYMEPPIGCEYVKCCDKPQIGTNAQFLELMILENKKLRESRLNDFGSNSDKTMRWGVSMTQKLMHSIEDYCLHTLKDPFWSTSQDVKEMNDFMVKFPEFSICKKV